MRQVIFDDSSGATHTSCDKSNASKLTALLFFDPGFENSKEIINLISLLDEFSNKHIDICIKGYTKRKPKSASATSICLNSNIYYYSAQTLREDVERLQSKTSWRFSMEIDVILVGRTRWKNKHGSGVNFDYKNAIVINLYRMWNDKKITSYASFFNEIIKFAEGYCGNNPVWDMSDEKLWKELKKSLFESFKKYIGFRKFQIKVEDYAVQDIRKKR